VPKHGDQLTAGQRATAMCCVICEGFIEWLDRVDDLCGDRDWCDWCGEYLAYFDAYLEGDQHDWMQLHQGTWALIGDPMGSNARVNIIIAAILNTTDQRLINITTPEVERQRKIHESKWLDQAQWRNRFELKTRTDGWNEENFRQERNNNAKDSEE